MAQAACVALPAGPHQAGTSHQHPEALQTASEGGGGSKGGKGGKEGFANSRGTWDALSI
jgi:hypothetical protein